MKIISFNVNGIRARIHQIQAVLEKHQPDLLGLQEIKVHDDMFPIQDILDLGYHPYFHGQKGHYGVAFLAKNPLSIVHKGFPTDEEDAQRRMIITELTTQQDNTITVLNGYFPQGESALHETKFPAKRKFYADLQQYLTEHLQPEQAVAVMGDINISPMDIDIGIGEPNRKRWLKTQKCSFLPEEREWLQQLLDWGLIDNYRHRYPEQQEAYSWFDYRTKGFNDNRGLRIDVVLTTSVLTEKLIDTGIDYETRGMEKPSDHAPVWSEFDY